MFFLSLPVCVFCGPFTNTFWKHSSWKTAVSRVKKNLFYCGSGDGKYRFWFFPVLLLYLILFKHEVVGCMHERVDVSVFWPISDAQLVLAFLICEMSVCSTPTICPYAILTSLWLSYEGLILQVFRYKLNLRVLSKLTGLTDITCKH